MSDAVISLNSDLKRLRDEGFELEVQEGCAIIHDIPYLNSSGSIQFGILVSPLGMSGDRVQYNGDHRMYFQGDIPYRANGERLNAVFNTSMSSSFGGVSINMMLSNKPAGNYKDYYEKFTRYIQLITSEAQAIDPSVTAATFKRVVSQDDDVFYYSDTNSSRAAIMDIAEKLKGQKIAIVGLGGTGSYILDQIAKTPVSEIHLFDGDTFCQHNAFRAPGAPCTDVFKERPAKVDYYTRIYSNMHRHIIPHPYALDEQNVFELEPMTFVFLAIDAGASKRVLVDYLLSHAISFIDSGIDIQRTGTSLIGMTRATLSQSGDGTAAKNYISYAETDKDLYSSNVQTADLNAFSALCAVIQWKKTLGFYSDCIHKDNCIFSTNSGEFVWD